MPEDTLYNDTLHNDSLAQQATLFKLEVPGKQYGEAGETLPYSIATDSYVAIGLLACVAVSLVSLARSWRFIRFQAKNLLRMPRENSFEMRETLNEMQYMAYFWLQGILLYTLITYEAAKEFVATEYCVDDYMLMAVYCGIITGYFILRGTLNLTVLPVFFPKSARHLAGISRTFLIAMQGVLLLPIVLLHAYAGMSVKTTLYSALTVLAITILLRFYKTYRMFFGKKGGFLQFFLYLCTLETVPFALLMGALLFTANYLKIKL